jgi:hypothetical protein
MKNELSCLVGMKFSKILINRSKDFSLILLSDVEDGAGLIPDAKWRNEAQASIQTIHSNKNSCTLLQEATNKIIHVSQKIVSDVSINNEEIKNNVASITFKSKKRRTKIMVPNGNIIALSLSSKNTHVSIDILSQYIEQLILAGISGMQGIIGDAVWLNLNGEVKLKMNPSKPRTLLRETNKINKLFFLSEESPRCKRD